MFASELTRAVQRYDRDLFAALSIDGLMTIYRKVKRPEYIGEIEGGSLFNIREAREFVLALTDNWTSRGSRRNWGTDFVLNRLREMDLQSNERFFEELDRQSEKAQESKDRDLDNHLEAWASDSRRAFAKATDDILVHSLSKDEPRKRRKDRSIKNGNY